MKLPRLIPDWKDAYKWFSVHGALLVSTLATVYAYFPAFRAFLPGDAFAWVTAGLGLAIIAGRLIQQGVIEVKEPS